MHVKDIVDETYQDYRLPAMLVCAVSCDMKCCAKDPSSGRLCQNAALLDQPTINIPDEEILKRYLQNPLTKAVVIGGLEPVLQFPEVCRLIKAFRMGGCMDDFVIYTGYDKHELPLEYILALSLLENVVVKFGRYIPDRPSRYDEVLGVTLASDNQYAERVE